MKEIQAKMRILAQELLASGQVTLVIGWQKGRLWYKPSPVFIREAADTEKLVFDEFCHNNLVKYLIDLTLDETKIAVFVKGCDSRAVLRLLQDNCLDREKIYLIGIPCQGLLDPVQARDKKQGEEIKVAAKCEICQFPEPVICDLFLGEKAERRDIVHCAEDIITKLEMTSADERYQFWSEQFSKCIRCYACRNICPACNCRECIFDQAVPEWLGKANNLCENQFMQLTRAMHVAGRCIECGECERACPMNIPLMAINKKLAKDIRELFGDNAPGTELEQKPPLGHFKLNDPEKFL